MATPMKVIQVLPALEAGGVERGTLEIAAALVAAGHQSVVVSAGGRLVNELCQAGTQHVCWNIGRKRPATLLEVRRFRRWLAAQNADILHVRSRLPAWICWLAWRRLSEARRPRFVTTVHGLYSVNAYSAVMTRGERVIVVSDTARRYVVDNYPRTAENKLTRIFRGVDRTRYQPCFRPSARWLETWRADFPQLAGKRLVILPGRLTRLKGHHQFIEALAKLRATHGDVAGVAVGGAAPEHRALEEILKARAPWLVFTGHRTDLREIMAISSAVVSFSTHPESFGRTVLEALMLGTPVVGYDHGGVGEILGQLFPAGRAVAGDAEDAAERLAVVLADEEAARKQIRAAVDEHGQLFDIEHMCSQTLDVYRQLHGERSP